MKKTIFIFIIVLIVTAGFAKVPPGSVGLSSKRLNRITQNINKQIEEEKLGGIVALVARNGQIAYHEAFGMMDANKPMAKDALFRIASMTKPVTSVAVMILYEEGYFMLSDPVSKYIPEFRNMKVIKTGSTSDNIEVEPAKSKIQIRHLLNHTSGMTYGGKLHSKLYRKANIKKGLEPSDITLEENVKNLAQLPLISQPGEEFNYSLSIDVLGYLVEVVSGQKLEDFFKERIFIPLKMNDTSFKVPKNKFGRLARTYKYKPNEGLNKLSDSRIDYVLEQKYYSGGAGLISTAQDYFRFAQMILNNGELDGVRILSRKTIELMTTNSIGDLYADFREKSGDKFGYGFGIRTERGKYDELESLGILGWDGAFYTRFWIDPKEQLVGIFLSQMDNNWNSLFINKYRNLVYQAIVD